MICAHCKMPYVLRIILFKAYRNVLLIKSDVFFVLLSCTCLAAFFNWVCFNYQNINLVNISLNVEICASKDVSILHTDQQKTSSRTLPLLLVIANAVQLQWNNQKITKEIDITVLFSLFLSYLSLCFMTLSIIKLEPNYSAVSLSQLS